MAGEVGAELDGSVEGLDAGVALLLPVAELGPDAPLDWLAVVPV